MATSIVDALVITLGIDTSNYDKGQKRVSSGLKKTRDDAGDTAKFMEAQGKRASGFFSSIRNEILALAGVSLTAAGLTSFVKNTTQGLMQLSIQSQALGMSARALDGWGKAASEAGSNAEKITGTLNNFQNALQAFRSGDASSPVFKALAYLNADTGTTFNPANQSTDSLLRSVSGALQKERSGDRARYIAQMLGIDDATLQSMRAGTFVSSADRYTRQSGITDQDTKNAREFNQQMTEISQKFEKVGYIIFNSLSPYISQFLGYLNDFATWLSTHPKEIQKAFRDIADTISEVAKVANQAADSVGGWKNAILLLIGASVGGKLLGFLGLMTRAFSGIFALTPPAWVLAAVGVGAYAANNINTAVTQADHTSSFWESVKQRWNAGGWYNNQQNNNPNSPAHGKALLGFMSGQFAELEAKYGLPTGLLRSVATVESGGNPYATSGAGAQGLFQFMPGTAKQLGINPLDPSQAAQGAARYLSQLLQQTGGNLEATIAAYNWGIGNVQRKGLGAAPAETRNYVPKVLAGLQTGAALNYQGYSTPSASGAPQYNFGTVNISSPARSVDQLTTDMVQTARNRVRILGFESGQN